MRPTAGAAPPGARVASIADIGLPGVTPVFGRLVPDDLQALVHLCERADSRSGWE